MFKNNVQQMSNNDGAESKFDWFNISARHQYALNSRTFRSLELGTQYKTSVFKSFCSKSFSKDCLWTYAVDNLVGAVAVTYLVAEQEQKMSAYSNHLTSSVVK